MSAVRILEARFDGKWVPFMPVIGNKPEYAKMMIGRTLDTAVRFQSTDEDEPKIS